MPTQANSRSTEQKNPDRVHLTVKTVNICKTYAKTYRILPKGIIFHAPAVFLCIFHAK